MKKKLLPLAMLQGLAGAAGKTKVVDVDSGFGEEIIYPFYETSQPPPMFTFNKRPKRKGRNRKYGMPK